MLDLTLNTHLPLMCPWAGYLTSQSVFSSTSNLLYLRFARRSNEIIYVKHLAPCQAPAADQFCSCPARPFRSLLARTHLPGGAETFCLWGICFLTKKEINRGSHSYFTLPSKKSPTRYGYCVSEVWCGRCVSLKKAAAEVQAVSAVCRCVTGDPASCLPNGLRNFRAPCHQ